MQTHPDIIELQAELPYSDFVDACHSALAAFRRARLPDFERWSIPSHARARKQGLEDALQALRSGERKLPAEDQTLQVWFSDADYALIFLAWKAQQFTLELSGLTTERNRDGRHRVVETQRDVCRALAEDAALSGARNRWVGPGADCLPAVPIAGARSQLIATTAAAVAEAYEDPKSFWTAWDEVEEHGGVRLCARALGAADGPEFLERVLESHWALARAAKAGRTEYFLPQVEDPRERRMCRRGERRMQMVGHDPATGLIELACVLGPDEHIRGWEILDLWHALAGGEALDGRKVTEARVVFLDRETAEREKRPLLDVGARVFYQGEEGDVELAP